MGQAGVRETFIPTQPEDDEYGNSCNYNSPDRQLRRLLSDRSFLQHNPFMTSSMDDILGGQRPPACLTADLASPPLASPLFSPYPAPSSIEQAAPTDPQPNDVFTTPVAPSHFATPSRGVGNTLASQLRVGGPLAPMPVLPQPRAQPLIFRSSKLNPSALRLPSFEALGIAAPHPDRFGCRGLGPLGDATPAEMEGDAVGDWPATPNGTVGVNTDQESEQRKDSFIPLKPDPAMVSPFQLYLAGLTPPVDAAVVWPTEGDDLEASSLSGEHTVGAAGTITTGADISGSTPSGQGGEPWIQGAITMLLANIPRAAPSLSILSHALPSPSSAGHIFTTIVAAMHQSTPGADTVWINVFHAVPSRFNLADMPTSPPGTPAPTGSGEDYFTSKIFDSAVTIPDYQQDLSHLARSPRSVVRPSSIDISIVERYIPPTNTREIENLFRTDVPSILVDRLIELSPDHGSIVFIYPTRRGALTFMNEYLSPILDRALRSMAIVHNFPSDFSRLVGNMAAIQSLYTHEVMKSKMQELCSRLSAPDSPLLRRLNSPPSNATAPQPQPSNNNTSSGSAGLLNSSIFTLSHSSKASIRLSRETWARDWWTKQEKPRVRSIITRFVNDPARRIDDLAATPVALLQQLLDDVTRKPYPPGQGPRNGVEVSIFVLRRSRR